MLRGGHPAHLSQGPQGSLEVPPRLWLCPWQPEIWWIPFSSADLMEGTMLKGFFVCINWVCQASPLCRAKGDYPDTEHQSEALSTPTPVTAGPRHLLLSVSDTFFHANLAKAPAHHPAASALLRMILMMPTTWTTWESPLHSPGASLWALVAWWRGLCNDSPASAGDIRDLGSIPGVGKLPG